MDRGLLGLVTSILVPHTSLNMFVGHAEGRVPTVIEALIPSCTGQLVRSAVRSQAGWKPKTEVIAVPLG
jgi:hypothetical protein